MTPHQGLCRSTQLRALPQTPVVLGRVVQRGSEGRAPSVYLLGLFSIVYVLVSLYFYGLK